MNKYKKLNRLKLSVVFNKIDQREKLIYEYNLFILREGGRLIKRTSEDTEIRVQTLDETDFISYSSNTIGKGMNPISLPPAMGK